LLKIIQRTRPTPRKFDTARRVFERFIQNEREAEKWLVRYLKNCHKDRNLASLKEAQSGLFGLGFESSDLDIFSLEGPFTVFCGGKYLPKSIPNERCGLIGLSYPLNCSLCAIFDSEIYTEGKGEMARRVFQSAKKLDKIVSNYQKRKMAA
jgi:hypothetical protein